MAYKINGTTVVDNSRNVCACCVTSCCVTASTRLDAPSGNTASRPGSPATGSLYFDTDEGSLIAYDGSAWSAVGGGGYPQVAAHCNMVKTFSANYTQDRQVKLPVQFNNAVANITGSYKAGSNYATTLLVSLKSTGTQIELQDAGGGGNSPFGDVYRVGQSYISQDKNFFSFTGGGESNFCTCIRTYGFDSEKMYQIMSCNRTTGFLPQYLGMYGNGTKLFGIHNSGHFGLWCCTGSLICMGFLCRSGFSYSGIQGIFETCSGDIGVLAQCKCFIVHLDLDTLAYQCSWCYSPEEYADCQYSPVQTTCAVGWGMCCRWGYAWNKYTCCLYKVQDTNSGSSYSSSARPMFMSINNDLYLRSWAQGSYCCTRFEKVAPDGSRNCYLAVRGSPSYCWTENMHLATNQNLGEKLITIHGLHTGSGNPGQYAAVSTDVSISHSGFKTAAICCLAFTGSSLSCTGTVAANFGVDTSCTYTPALNCCNCLKIYLCVSCLTC